MRHEGDWLQRTTLAVGGAIISILAAIAACAQPYEIIPSTPPTTPQSTIGLDPTFTPTLIPTLTKAPTETATALPTVTNTSTPDWDATPTRIWPHTPSIIEVTALGGYAPTPTSGYEITTFEAWYMPVDGLRVRERGDYEEPSLTLPIVKKLYAEVQVFARIIVYPQGDVWLCVDGPPALYVDSMCNQVVGYIIGGVTFGSVYHVD